MAVGLGTGADLLLMLLLLLRRRLLLQAAADLLRLLLPAAACCPLPAACCLADRMLTSQPNLAGIAHAFVRSDLRPPDAAACDVLRLPDTAGAESGRRRH